MADHGAYAYSRVPRVLEEGAHDDGKEAAADAPAAEHGREGESEPPLEPVRHHHVAHVEDHTARELPVPNTSASCMLDRRKGGSTDADSETLAEEELPVFRALCGEEHAHDE